MDPRQVQLRAADTILRKGVRVPIVSAPLLLRLFGIRRIGLTIRQPSLGGLVMISRLVVSMNLEKEDFEKLSLGDCHRLVERHGDTLMRIFCIGVLRHWPLVGLSGLLARYLRWRVEPALLSYAVKLLLELSDVADFTITIRSVAQKMTYLSPRTQGSQQPAG